MWEEAHIDICPLADGGEGTVEALESTLNWEKRKVFVSDALGRPVLAEYLIKGENAIIEMAKAAGLTLIEKKSRNIFESDTFGVGEIIKDAIERGARKFLVGIGGSATNDGGVGMLRALGYEFLDKEGKEAGRGAKALGRLEKISDKNALKQLKECSFEIMCDVSNPLIGEKGAAEVFAAQKGASKEDIKILDEWLKRFAQKTKELIKNADEFSFGAGAAGGLGFAFKAYLNAKMASGVDAITDIIGLKEKIRLCDLVITGEGRLDNQTVFGKAPLGIAKRAKEEGKTVIAFCGSAAEDADEINGAGIDAYFPIIREITSLEQAMECENAKKNLQRAAKQAFLLIKAASK